MDAAETEALTDDSGRDQAEDGQETPPETDADAIPSDESLGAEGEATEAPAPAPQTTDISFSGDLYNFLANRQISIAFTSYQTGILYILGHGLDRKLSLHQAHYPQAMGVVGDGQRIVGGAGQLVSRLRLPTLSMIKSMCRAISKPPARSICMKLASLAKAKLCSSTPNILASVSSA